MGDFGCLLDGCLLEIVWEQGNSLGCCEKQVVNSYWVLNIYCYNGCLLIGCLSGKWIGNWEWLWSVVEVIGDCTWLCEIN